MSDLFTFAAQYPQTAGYKEETTSKEAAASVDAKGLRKAVLKQLAVTSLTADECAERLGMSILSIRPRLSELKAMRRVIDTGERRKNASGKSAKVWALAA